MEHWTDPGQSQAHAFTGFVMTGFSPAAQAQALPLRCGNAPAPGRLPRPSGLLQLRLEARWRMRLFRSGVLRRPTPPDLLQCPIWKNSWLTPRWPTSRLSPRCTKPHAAAAGPSACACCAIRRKPRTLCRMLM
ncbi:hypothetical protein THIX_10431 [Thiomonas sp. X19]|nr:hypothetical protein THIX_10431 [Thiomonas sp. X19]